MMAAADNMTIEIEGVGGHAARPHLGDRHRPGRRADRQPLQSIVSRNVDPLKSAVVSICMFQAGNADNVIPQTAQLRGTARSLDADVRDLLEKRIAEVVEGTARLYGANARARLSARLSGDWSTTSARPISPPRSPSEMAGARQGRRRHAAGDGRRGFLLHAGGAARRLHLRRQRRQRRPASPRLQFQRRSDPVRHVVLGAAGRRRRWPADALRLRRFGLRAPSLGDFGYDRHCRWSDPRPHRARRPSSSPSAASSARQ